ncbi:MAG: hypothetical protein HKN31_05655, partial [Pricia sp.]|nr:hypothetical protein [Pricia sp.]
EGLKVLGEGDEWLQNFDKAIAAGMGIKMKIDPTDTAFEKIIVSGFRHDSDPLVPAHGLTDLFNNHRYTEGFSFLRYATPTNNTENAVSGHSAKEEFEVGNSFAYAVEGLDLGPETQHLSDLNPMTAGKYLSNTLGFESEQLKHVRHADLRPSALNETYQRATWFALGAQPLFMLLGSQLDSQAHSELWEHYSKYVKHRGLFAALKIGKQPYGILPVMNISNVFLPENKDIRESKSLFDKIWVVLAHLKKRWLAMTEEIPRMEGDIDREEILRILSMQEASSAYQIRALQYPFFKARLFEQLKGRSSNIDPLKFLEVLGKDYEGVRENISSLSQLFDLNDDELSESIDQFLRAPLLSFTQGSTNLIGFQDNHVLITDDQGNVVADKNNTESNFSFTQEDLSNFQDFIGALKNQKENELVQYRGDLSLFTDLFLRSYTNACQLYNREITWDPQVAELSSDAINFNGLTIEKSEGSTVTKGETVFILQLANAANIEIKAPFDGKIKKIWLNENNVKNIVSGTPLFTLIDETNYNQIKRSFIEMGEQLITENNALSENRDRAQAQQKAIAEAIDLNSYRLDAWITSLAARRIVEMRDKPDYKKGIYFGAYGWIENLERHKEPVNPATLTDRYRENGGIIHTPGAGQTVASTVFKNSFLANRHEVESNPFTINLSSDRLQKSQVLLDGIREGQQLEALLGYQLERHLHEDDLHEEIYALREAFPLYENSISNTKGFVQLSVIDGLKAINRKENLPATIPNIKKAQVIANIEKLEDTMDASLDVLFYEAGYQVTQGNISQAAAALGATKGELVPPPIESLQTKIPGTGMNHKLVMLFPQSDETFPLENIRAFMEPNLEKWLASALGPIDQLECSVEIRNAQDDSLLEKLTVNLAALDLGYLDFLYLSEEPVFDGASELELRIRNAARNQHGSLAQDVRYVIRDTSNKDRSILQGLEVVRYAKALLDKCRYLKSNDLTLESDTLKYDRLGLDDMKENRLQPLLVRLRQSAAADLSQKNTLALLAKMDFESAKVAFLNDSSINIDQLKSALTRKIGLAEEQLAKYNSELPFYMAFGCLEQAAKILLGESFFLLPPAMGSDNFVQVLNDKKQHLIVGHPANKEEHQLWGQERIRNWIQGVAQVHENSELFEDWSMVNTVWNETMGLNETYDYKIVQGPTLSQYPWVALSQSEIDQLIKAQYADQPIFVDSNSGEAYPLADGTYYPENCEATVIYGPTTADLEKPVFGLVIEEFSEHIPDKKMDTGLSFHYNTPNNEPPQAILLAIHPKATMDSEFFWSEEDLRDVLFDTIDLYKIRMVDIEAIQEYGYILPMTYWFNTPRGK